VSGRAAQAAAASDPDLNVQFRRWPAPATGPQDGTIRSWHAADLPPPPPMSPARRRAEREWRRIVREAAQ
jgi:hypothetical protein